jgi:hypothetical protein
VVSVTPAERQRKSRLARKCGLVGAPQGYVTKEQAAQIAQWVKAAEGKMEEAK